MTFLSTQKKKGREKRQYQTTVLERITYPLYYQGQGMSSGFIGPYLMIFYTNTLQISPFVISIFLLITKAWDAINDPLFGIIVDRVRFKNAKFIPWLRIGCFAVPISTILLFQVSPTLPMTLRIVMAFVTYLFWDLSFTISEVPSLSTLSSMTGNSDERNVLLTLTGAAIVIPSVLTNLLVVPMLKTETPGAGSDFASASLVLGLVCFVMMILFPFVGKERHRDNIIISEDKNRLIDVWHYVKGNKFLLYFCIYLVFFSVSNIPMSAYIMQDIFGGLEKSALPNLLSIPVVFLITLSFPFLARKFDRRNMLLFFAYSYIVLQILTYFIGYSSYYVYVALFVVKFIPAGFFVLAGTAFIMDTVEYGQYKTGLRKEGITFAINSFVGKFSGAVAASFGALFLGLIGYSVGEGVVQTSETISRLWAVAHWVPAAGLIVALPFLHAFKLNSNDAQIMSDINTGIVQREEGEALMTRKY